ncbi:hypothetical protein BDV40DRAFT_255334 [Aspergillus tamarii]|uniref:Uncharacterized protein n=1 Tax=Aspergillus tamarii TaxID=41984 RepID=A0A5N6V9X9_ASPTM|nr:hypothetical protein BDV40DRAFT_255334 [Aspergillus tamarii]
MYRLGLLEVVGTCVWELFDIGFVGCCFLVCYCGEFSYLIIGMLGIGLMARCFSCIENRINTTKQLSPRSIYLRTGRTRILRFCRIYFSFYHPSFLIVVELSRESTFFIGDIWLHVWEVCFVCPMSCWLPE